jgi:hypothetical protein
MSTCAKVLIVAGALVTASVSAPSAQTSGTAKPGTPEPQKAIEVKTLPLLHIQPDNPKNPYRGVFEPQKELPAHAIPVTPQTFMRSRQSPRVVCGMTLIPADANIDPGILVKVPDLETRYAIRAIKPPVCLPD